MMMFVLNLKELNYDLINASLGRILQLDRSQIDSLIGDNANAIIKYEYTLRNKTEFMTELVLYCQEEFCLTKKIYNDLHIALPLAKDLKQDIVIDDQSEDPYQWILVRSNGELFVVSELVDGEEIGSFIIDYSSMKKVTLKQVLAVLPSREYVKEDPELRQQLPNPNRFWWKN